MGRPNSMPNKLSIITENVTDIAGICNGKIVVALNIFSMGHFSLYFEKSHEQMIFWIDGLAAKIWASWKLRTIVQKMAGPDYLRRLLRDYNGDFILVGSKPSGSERIFRDCGWSLLEHYEMKDFSFDLIDRINTSKFSGVILVTLPSPKQELFAVSNFGRGYSIHCVGGALNMVCNPALEAPILIRRFGLEWLFRLKSDPSRRVKRLLASIFGLAGNIFVLWKYRLHLVDKTS